MNRDRNLSGKSLILFHWNKGKKVKIVNVILNYLQSSMTFKSLRRNNHFIILSSILDVESMNVLNSKIE